MEATQTFCQFEPRARYPDQSRSPGFLFIDTILFSAMTVTHAVALRADGPGQGAVMCR